MYSADKEKKKGTVLSLQIAIILLFTTTIISGQYSDPWESWKSNDFDTIEKSFKEAIDDNPDNYRNYFGLSFLYELKYNSELSWEYYKKGLERIKNKKPYVAVSLLTRKLLDLRNIKDHDYLKYIKNLAFSEKESGGYQAKLNEKIGIHYQDHGELDSAKTYFNKLGAITDWQLIGPFENISASGYDKVFPPENEFSPEEIYKGKYDIPVHWFTIEKVRIDDWIDFELYFSDNDAIFYGNTFVYSPEKRKIQLRIGTSGSLKAFLNDEQIIEYFDENNNDLDTYIAETELQQGWNRLLVKTGYSELNRCNFMVRITDEKGFVIDDLKISDEKKDYESKPGAEVKEKKIEYEEFFENMVKSEPDNLENYIFLASAYLQNDKAIESEKILKKALEKWPDNILIYTNLAEAYTRGEKTDEAGSTLKKLTRLNKNHPLALEDEIGKAIEKKDTEELEKLLGLYENVVGDYKNVDVFKLSLYGLKNQREEMIKLAEESYNKYPYVWEVVYLYALVQYGKTMDPAAAAEVLDKYYSANTTQNVIGILANFYLQSGNIEKWEETFLKGLEYYPASSGYYQKLGQVLTTQQKYDKAENYIREAIKICPIQNQLYEQLGDILKEKGEKEKAIEAFETSLKYYPANYDSREKLRELKGLPTIYSMLPEYDIKSAIKNSPSDEDYPNQGAIFLIDDYKYIVHDKGASEFSEEMLIKVLNKNGIDSFKEYWIGHNGYAQSLTVEKAEVIKADGSIVEADQDGGYLVFKTLEENDFLYIKYRIKNYYRGKLAPHFWDSFNFNLFYPISKVRYTLVVPDDLEFNYKTQNMENAEPVKSKLGEKDVYTWELSDVKDVDWEEKMPLLSDVGKMLYISSIEDWTFISNWYLDLAETKTRPTYEIEETYKELTDGKDNLNDREKAKLIYDYISDNIRYSMVPFRQSAFVPQKARNVLVNKIGDCKDMATLAVSMLRVAGIKSWYVLVNTFDEGQNINTLPSIAFNHAIAAAEIDGEIVYMDLTAKNYPFGTLPLPDLDAFSLLIREGEQEPFYMQKGSMDRRSITRKANMIINPDNSVSISRNAKRFGGVTAGMRESFRFKDKEEQLKIIKETLSDDFSNFDIKDISFENLENLSDELTYSYDFLVKDYLNDAGGFKILELPWSSAASASSYLSGDERKYKINYRPYYQEYSEIIEFILPEGYTLIELPGDIELDCDVMEYSLSFSREGDKITCTKKYRNKKSFIDTDDYQEYKEFYNQRIKADNTQLLLRKEN